MQLHEHVFERVEEPHRIFWFLAVFGGIEVGGG
jgi:hypothetical protein